IAWLFATFITVNPARRSSFAEDGSARKVKQPSEPYGEHFGEPATASVPSRFAKTMSPCRKRRIPAKVDEVAPCPTSATSPPATIVTDPPGLTTGSPNAPARGTAQAAAATTSATARRGGLTTAELSRMHGGSRQVLILQGESGRVPRL